MIVRIGFFLPNGPDVAIIPLDLNPKVHNIKSVHFRNFLENKPKLLRDITVGDDVFMLGLFVDHLNKNTNNPFARFGNISMLANPELPIGDIREAHYS